MSGIGPSSMRKAIRRKVTLEARSRPPRKRMRQSPPRLRQRWWFQKARRQLHWRKLRNKSTSQIEKFLLRSRFQDYGVALIAGNDPVELLQFVGTSHRHAQFFHL